MEFLAIAQSTQQLEAGQHVLGGICHTKVDAEGTLLQVPLPLLEGSECLQEFFLINTPPTVSEFSIPDGTVRYSKTSEFVFGHVKIVQNLSTQSMGETSQQAYCAILQLCQDINMPNILRLWNFVPHINAPEGETERYRLFSAGRWQAFSEYQQTVSDGSPAACALGSFDDTLKIAFLASTQKPQSIENPRQVSAYFYPQQYGVIPPVFSRAALFRQHVGTTLFISGTASIIGHASCHKDDIQAQTDETLRNLSSLLTQVNLIEKNGQSEQAYSRQSWDLSELYCRIYIRHPEHLQIIQSILQQAGIKHAVYLQADICRAELLLEIEAIANHLYQNFNNKTAA